MLSVFLLILLLPGLQAAPPAELSVASLKKGDLPNDFPFQIFDVGFAVVRVAVVNATEDILALDPDGLVFRGPDGKQLRRARPEEITPRLMKYYKGSARGVAGDVYGRTVPMPGSRDRTQTVDPRARGGTVSIEVPARLRNILSYYEIQAGDLGPGEKSEGFVYLKSRKSGSRLSGGSAAFVNALARIP